MKTCINGCDRKIIARGMCKSCYSKWRYAKPENKIRCNAQSRTWYAKNAESQRLAVQEDRRLNPDKHRMAARKYRYKRVYGIELQDYESMFAAQNGVCAICSSAPSRKMRLCVDHCHRTGKVRSLLCNLCNFAVGILEKDDSRYEQVKDYVSKWSEL